MSAKEHSSILLASIYCKTYTLELVVLGLSIKDGFSSSKIFHFSRTFTTSKILIEPSKLNLIL